jgi:diguanylate cyclase (GGDEF)-like protein/PAS domain S-box-containing protein
MQAAEAAPCGRTMREVLESRFFHEAPLLLCLADLEGRFTSVGGPWERTLGWSTAELLAKPFLAFVHPDDLPATLSEVEQLSRGEPTIRFVNRYRRKDGGWVTLQWNAQAPVDGTIFAIAQDITATQQRDQALARRSAVLEALAEVQRAFIEEGLTPAVLQRMLRRLLAASESALGVVATLQPRDGTTPALVVQGWATTDLAVRSMPPFLEQLEAPYGAAVTALQAVRLAAPPEGTLPTELPLPVHSLMALPLDGATRGMAGGVLLLANRSGGYEPGWEPLLEPLASALGAMVQLQERRAQTAAMEGELQRWADLFAVVFDAAVLTVITTDAQGAIRYMNPLASQLLGASALEHATNLATFHDPAELAAAAAPIQELDGLPPFDQLVTPARAAGGSDRREWTYVSLAGVRYAMRVTMSALRDRQGRTAGWVAVGTELSELRQAEADRSRVAVLEAELWLLRQRMAETARISEAAAYVAASRTVREALSVIGALLPTVYQGSAPQLLVPRSGDRPRGGDADALPPGCVGIDLAGCWGYTTGQPFVSVTGGVRCAHLAGVAGDWGCAPLSDGARVVAVLSAPLPAVRAVAAGPEAGEAAREGAVAALREEARQFSAVLANLQLRHTLEEQALRDPLTGAINRRQLERELRVAMHRVARGGAPCALLMLDVDHFKRINDVHGHETGDAVLTGLVALLRQRLRATDVLARVGGEEFMVVLRDVDRGVALQLAETLRAAVEGTWLVGGTLKCTCSIGGVHVDAAGAALGVEHHWRHADQALYEAKGTGRNRVCFWSDQVPAGHAGAGA